MHSLRGRRSKGKEKGIRTRGCPQGGREERNSFLLPPFSRVFHASRAPQIPFPFRLERLPRRLLTILYLAALRLWSDRICLYRANSHCTDSSLVVSHAVSYQISTREGRGVRLLVVCPQRCDSCVETLLWKSQIMSAFTIIQFLMWWDKWNVQLSFHKQWKSKTGF